LELLYCPQENDAEFVHEGGTEIAENGTEGRSRHDGTLD